MKTLVIALSTLSLALLSLAGDQKPQRKHYEANPAAKRPFSDAVLIGDTLYLAGKIGVDRKTNKVPETAEAEARLVLDEIKGSLTAANMTMDDLVFVQVFCSDVTHYDAFNKVYRTYFSRELPARAFIGSGKLLFEARFEVQGIAVKR